MAGESRQRLDKWLFFARVVKSRSLGAKLVQAGRVRINGAKAGQASDQVKAGDVLTVSLERNIAILRVVGAGARRGPYEEARRLYEDISPEPAARGLPDALVPAREAGAGRPTKKDRREIERFFGPEE